jgi:hypothetical protein
MSLKNQDLKKNDGPHTEIENNQNGITTKIHYPNGYRVRYVDE